MSQSSDNPVRQARRRAWAQKVLPSAEREREMREIARKMSRDDLEEITALWLTGIEAGEQGDPGVWASELMRLRRN